ncbi:MAG TPA: shikimate kinase [Candidatus Lokiarchaeia archaeon]|nr:shikimate kinase [Candidatus Lokiarchaeia archaeon]
MANKTNICLVGFMGTGKSTAGNLVAQQLGKQYIETDALIEQKAGKSIPEIFSEDGEIHFRELEIETIREAASNVDTVFSLGGGAVLNQINMMYMRQSSVIICLEARPEIILDRILQDGKETRPLLAKNDPLQEIKKLLATRAPFYAMATIPNLVIDTSDRGIDEVAVQIISLYEEYKEIS